MTRPFAPGLLLALLALAALPSRPSQAQTQTLDALDRVVAVVDEDVILQSELNRSVEAILTQAQGGGSPPPRPLVERQVLDRLILTRIQLDRAQSTGIRVSDGEIDAAVDRVAAQTIGVDPTQPLLNPRRRVFRAGAGRRNPSPSDESARVGASRGDNGARARFLGASGIIVGDRAGGLRRARLGAGPWRGRGRAPARAG